MTMTELKVYRVEEVAKILRAHPRTIYRMVERGEIRGLRVGTSLRITDEALQAFLKGERDT